MKTLHLLAATVAVGAVAAPAAAQQPYPQTYPVQSYPQQTYPAQPYGYPGQTTGTNVVEQIINQLLGNNSSYTFSDRTQVSRCATAALAQAGRQFGRYGYGSPYGQAYGGQQYSQPYGSQYDYANGYGQMRVTAITDVQRRSRGGLRIQGLISSGAYAQLYGYGYGYGYGGEYQGYQGQEYQDRRYADPRYAHAADLSFRCNVDYRGAVSGIRVSRYTTANRR